ncbi:MAG: hypothetical protein DMG34_07120 [Acidobacteria bacterium]|nr:MAG: hypothetical protein DMG34_07120 [Acidobacteriota bacterium]
MTPAPEPRVGTCAGTDPDAGSHRFPPGRTAPPDPLPPPPGTPPPPPNPGPLPPPVPPGAPREPSAARIICSKRLGSSRKSLNLSPCAPNTFAVRFAAILAPAIEESSAM